MLAMFPGAMKKQQVRYQNSQPPLSYIHQTSIVPLCLSFNDVSTLSSEISGECLSGLIRLSLSSCVDFVAGEEGGLDLEYSSSSKMEAVVELEGVSKLSLWRERNVLGASVD